MRWSVIASECSRSENILATTKRTLLSIRNSRVPQPPQPPHILLWDVKDKQGIYFYLDFPRVDMRNMNYKHNYDHYHYFLEKTNRPTLGGVGPIAPCTKVGAISFWPAIQPAVLTRRTLTRQPGQDQQWAYYERSTMGSFPICLKEKENF